MNPLEALRLIVAVVAIACSLAALVIYMEDVRWSNADRRRSIKLTARALLAREILRSMQVALLTAATVGVLLRDVVDLPGEWQVFINATQTIVLLLMAVATLFELYTRQQVNVMRDDYEAERRGAIRSGSSPRGDHGG